LPHRYCDIRGALTTGGFAAAGAVAVRETHERRCNFKGHALAKAASMKNIISHADLLDVF
jgi:hypothetical protein